MKKLNKKGFTIVELVIVIAVIGILSAVLIPTFSNLTEKANESAAEQAVTNEYKEWLVDYADEDVKFDKYILVEYKGFFYDFDGSKFTKKDVAKDYDPEATGQDYTVVADNNVSDAFNRSITGITDKYFQSSKGFTVYSKAKA